ncbi:barstar family protein [Streptomyces sp. NPDC052036]|uniref:barstar family protein n=1 Tax=Streptomyces sp. NPDC052036 TaxID=3155171 RepID=UPI00344A96BA
MTERQGQWAAIKPWFHVVSNGACVPVGELLPAAGLNFVASFQGADAFSVDDAFQKFWDAFKLPDYFGWNWPALHDCLRDLSWLPGDQYLLVISEAEKVLLGDEEGRLEFLRLLAATGRRWSYVRHPEGTETGRFKIVLMCSESHFDDLRNTFETLLHS